MDPLNRLKVWRLIQRLKKMASIVLTTVRAVVLTLAVLLHKLVSLTHWRGTFAVSIVYLRMQLLVSSPSLRSTTWTKRAC